MISSMVTAEKFKKATDEGFEKSTGGNTEPLKKEIELFNDLFKLEIEVNDVYDIVYMPEKGVEVFKNGCFMTCIEGLEFKKALFGIWFGKQPADDYLKKKMLGAS